MLTDRDYDVTPYIIARIVAQMSGWSGKSARWGGDGDGRGRVGGIHFTLHEAGPNWPNSLCVKMNVFQYAEVSSECSIIPKYNYNACDITR